MDEETATDNALLPESVERSDASKFPSKLRDEAEEQKPLLLVRGRPRDGGTHASSAPVPTRPSQLRSTIVCSDVQLRARRLRRVLGDGGTSALDAKRRTPREGISASAPLK